MIGFILLLLIGKVIRLVLESFGILKKVFFFFVKFFVFIVEFVKVFVVVNIMLLFIFGVFFII